MCLQLEPKVRAFAACWSHETLLLTYFLGARDFLCPGVFSTHGVMECHSSISTGSLWRLPAALSPHLTHARSSVSGFLLGPMQLWAEDHLAEKLYSILPRDVLRFLPQGDFPTSIAPLIDLLGPCQKSQGLCKIFFIMFFTNSIRYSSAL